MVRPNFKKIERAISNENSKYYYPNLLDRYKKADDTLQLEELRHLYYGYTFNKNYDGYKRSPLLDELHELVKQAEENGNTEIYLQIIEVSNQVLFDSPFDLDAIDYKLYANRILKNDTEIGNCHFQKRAIILAIASTGTGEYADTAYYVLSIPHERHFIRFLNMKREGSQALVASNFGSCDYIPLLDNRFNKDGLYFNVSCFCDSESNIKKELLIFSDFLSHLSDFDKNRYVELFTEKCETYADEHEFYKEGLNIFWAPPTQFYDETFKELGLEPND